MQRDTQTGCPENLLLLNVNALAFSAIMWRGSQEEATGVRFFNTNFVPLLFISFVLAAGIIGVCMALGRMIRHNRLTSWLALGGVME